jgi:cobalamin synthase
MTRHERGGSTVKRSLPYVGTAVGLVGGLVVLLFGPLPTPTLNLLVGGALLVVAVASVAYMVVAFGGPGERGPEF